MTTAKNEVVAIIKREGYKVFMPASASTWAYYTDGKQIGYVQWGRDGVKVCTVHQANLTSGTGFLIADEVTQQTLRAGFAQAPNWAYSADRQSVKKYPDWETFAKKYWCELVEV